MGNRNNVYRLEPFAIALYTAQGIPMLWEGQEFADEQLPPAGNAALTDWIEVILAPAVVAVTS